MCFSTRVEFFSLKIELISLNEMHVSTEISNIFQEFVFSSNKSFFNIERMLFEQRSLFLHAKTCFHILNLFSHPKIYFSLNLFFFFLNQFNFSSKDSFFHEKPIFTLKHLIFHKQIDSSIKFQYAHLRRILYFHQKIGIFVPFSTVFLIKLV